jgi:peptide/nickel transport system substrate-binding protein
MRRYARAAAFAAIVAFAGGCAPDASPQGDGADGPPVVGGTLVITSATDLDYLNSLVSSDRYTQEFLRFALFLPLLNYDEKLDYVPALAREWRLEGDSAVLFLLRDDIRWHDGVATTAHDVAFTFERAKAPATGFPNAEYFAHWTGVEVVDSLTVRFRMEPHAEPLAGVPFMPIMPRHLLETVPDSALRQAAFNRSPVGNGPFRFVEARAQDRWVFEANPAFPEALGGRPNVDRIVLRIIPDATAQVTELRTGGADLALNVRYEHMQEANADASIATVIRPSRQYAFIGWNNRRAPLDDARVRRALGLAIDRAEIVATLRGGRGELAAGPIGPHHWSYDRSVAPLPFSPDSARTLLLAAGFADRDADGVIESAAGQDLTITLKLPTGSSFTRDAAEMIVSDLRDIGVLVAIQPTEYNTLIGDLTSPARDFDAVLMGWESDFRINLRGLFHSAELANPYQFGGYRNARVDSLIERASAATQREDARPHLVALQREMRDDQPWAFLYYYPDFYLRSARLRGVHMDVRGALVGITDWWLAPASPAPQPGG